MRTLDELGRELRSGERSARVLAEECLERAAEHESLGAFVYLDGEAVLAAAEQADDELRAGNDRGPLHGIPVAIKDNLCTAGETVSCGSKILAGFEPVYDAHVIELLRDAGAVLFGKTNMDEFAMGSSCENSAWFPACNPWDSERVPGGSSGGSAVAVAAGITPLALGSDTGGSVRQPASFCGIAGLRPTWGRVSRRGLVAFASSLDQIGPMAVDVAGCAALFEAIAGHDPLDATSSDRGSQWDRDSLEAGVSGMRVGVLHQSRDEGVQTEVGAAFEAALDLLRDAGAEVREVRVPSTESAVPAYYLLASAEASSNLARFDGVRYGARVPSDDLDRMYELTRTEGFGAEVKRRILLGTFALSAGYYDAYYGKALAARRRMRAEFDAAFADVDLLVCPTAPTTAFALGEKTDDPWRMYLNDIFTIPAALTGLPALSVNCGFDVQGLPIGFQICGPAFAEAELFRAGRVIERAMEPLRRPELPLTLERDE